VAKVALDKLMSVVLTRLCMSRPRRGPARPSGRAFDGASFTSNWL